MQKLYIVFFCYENFFSFFGKMLLLLVLFCFVMLVIVFFQEMLYNFFFREYVVKVVLQYCISGFDFKMLVRVLDMDFKFCQYGYYERVVLF